MTLLTRNPYSDATVKRLYQTHDDYVAKVKAAAQYAKDQGWILEDDRAKFVSDAAASTIGC